MLGKNIIFLPKQTSYLLKLQGHSSSWFLYFFIKKLQKEKILAKIQYKLFTLANTSARSNILEGIAMNLLFKSDCCHHCYLMLHHLTDIFPFSQALCNQKKARLAPSPQRLMSRARLLHSVSRSPSSYYNHSRRPSNATSEAESSKSPDMSSSISDSDWFRIAAALATSGW